MNILQLEYFIAVLKGAVLLLISYVHPFTQFYTKEKRDLKTLKKNIGIFCMKNILVFLNRWKESVTVLYFYFYMKAAFVKSLTTHSNEMPFYTFYHVASR